MFLTGLLFNLLILLIQEEAPDLQKRIAVCFRSMSRLFHDHSKAEESLNALNQLKDANVWKLLSTLLDPATPFQQACSIRVTFGSFTVNHTVLFFKFVPFIVLVISNNILICEG